MINPVAMTPEQILWALEADPRRQIYTAEDGSLWIDYQGGLVANADDVKQLLAAGKIIRTWGDTDGHWCLAQ